MAETPAPPTLMTLPAELRNAIYNLIYVVQSPYSPQSRTESSIATPVPPRFSLASFGDKSPLDTLPASIISSNHHVGALLQTCKQIHTETTGFYFTRSTFHLTGPHATPEYFVRLVAPLRPAALSQIRHITLTGRINHLLAMNGSWDGYPFGNTRLKLDTLTVIPRRPHTHETHYAEVADLYQSHTLAHILAETLKGLKGVKSLIVRNDEECFNNIAWRLFYRSLVLRLWRWAGGMVGLMFRQDETEMLWFEISHTAHGEDQTGWKTAADEVERLVGAERKEALIA